MSKHIFVLTGAGVSAESGLGTFRDKRGEGIWARFDPMRLATPEAFARDPEDVLAFYDMRRRNLMNARPNAAHRALARLVGRVARDGGGEPERFDAKDVPTDDVVAALQTLSFGGLQAVIVTGADAWRAAEADAQLDADAKSFYTTLAAERKLLTIPADPNESAKLARHYTNASLGEIAVSMSGPSTIFDFGEWKSDVASRKNPDGTISFITIVPGVTGSEFVVGSGPKRTLIIRDAQHEYVYDER